MKEFFLLIFLVYSVYIFYLYYYQNKLEKKYIAKCESYKTSIENKYSSIGETLHPWKTDTNCEIKKNNCKTDIFSYIIGKTFRCTTSEMEKNVDEIEKHLEFAKRELVPPNER